VKSSKGSHRKLRLLYFSEWSQTDTGGNGHVKNKIKIIIKKQGWRGERETSTPHKYI